MELTWLDRENLDPADLAGAVAVAEAARVVNRPYRPVETVSSFLGWFRHGWDGEPPAIAVARDAGGRVVGLVEVSLPQRDNTHLAVLYAKVDPVLRDQGIERQLIEGAVERARAEGRKVVLAVAPDLPEPAALAEAMGFEPAYLEIERRQDVLAADWTRLDAEYAEAERRASGYGLLQIAGPVPDDQLEAVADLTAAINDAPTEGLDIEDEVFTPDRIRAFETAQAGRGRRLYRLIARERESGELAGHTVVGVESEQPWHADQFDTSVLAKHRGYRLGLLLKIGMLRWLRTAEPQLRFIDTDNAASNDHMIRVNELLGYEVVGQTICWQTTLE